jgi:hypothetical protein
MNSASKGSEKTSSPAISAEATSPPRRFSVGVSARGGVNAGGHLSVGPGDLMCEFGPVAGRVSGLESVRHRGAVVHIYKARLIPPWFNVGVVVDDGESVCLASTWLFVLKPLTKALTGAGFRVVLHRTWTYRGLHLGEILRGAREPGAGVGARLGPTITERVLASRRTLAVYCVMGICASGVLAWQLGGVIAGALAATFATVGAGITLWYSWIVGRTSDEERKQGE